MTQAEKVIFNGEKKSRCDSTLYFLTLLNKFWADLGSFRTREKVYGHFKFDILEIYILVIK